jgi:hypothetical protein
MVSMKEKSVLDGRHAEKQGRAGRLTIGMQCVLVVQQEERREREEEGMPKSHRHCILLRSAYTSLKIMSGWRLSPWSWRLFTPAHATCFKSN